MPPKEVADRRRAPRQGGTQTAPGGRLYYLDACRAVFMLLGIVLHAAMPYMYFNPWLVEAPQQSWLLTHLNHFIGAFRMPGFFIIAGFFAALVLAKQGSNTWIRSRGFRLGIPLAFGVIFIVPLESLALSFADYLTQPEVVLTDVVPAALEQHAAVGFHQISHLWFILDLLLLSCCVAAAYWLLTPGGVGTAAERAGDMLANWPVALGIATLAALALYRAAVELAAFSEAGRHIAAGGEMPMWHIFDGGRLAYYAPFLALGLMLFHSRPLLERFVRPSPSVWLAGLLLTLALLKLRANPEHSWTLGTMVSAPAAVLLTRMAMQVAARLVRKHNGIVQWLADGSYTIYIVHHPFVIFLAAIVIYFNWGSATGFLFTLLGAAALSAGFYAVTRESLLAKFLLTGLWPKREFGSQ
jgi:glucans biosynthesis protein C